MKQQQQQQNKAIHVTALWPPASIVCSSKQSIPSQSGFLELLAETPAKATIGYGPFVTAHPIEMSIIHDFIGWALNILKKLDIEQMFNQVDQAVLSELLV